MKESLFSRAVLWLVFLFLLGPFAIVVLAGFSGGETLAFPPESYSLRWIIEVWSAPEFRRAFQTSLEIGLIATVIALLLG
ncbi:MAG: ABC transporter permease, partial [Janthinobacterium sp.]